MWSGNLSLLFFFGNIALQIDIPKYVNLTGLIGWVEMKVEIGNKPKEHVEIRSCYKKSFKYI